MVALKTLVSSVCWCAPHPVQNWQFGPGSSITVHPALAQLIFDPEVCHSFLLTSNACAVDFTMKNCVKIMDSPLVVLGALFELEGVGAGGGVRGLGALYMRLLLLHTMLLPRLPVGRPEFLLGAYSTWWT